MTSVFDAQALVDSLQNETNERRPPIPVHNPDDATGTYMAVIGEITVASGTIGKGENVGKPWVQMVVPLRLQLGSQAQSLGLPSEFTVTDRPMLDVTPQGGLDNSKGKNNGQRIYREATGLNKPGEVFAWRMLTGKTVRVKLTHEMYNGSPVEKVQAILPS